MKCIERNAETVARRMNMRRGGQSCMSLLLLPLMLGSCMLAVPEVLPQEKVTVVDGSGLVVVVWNQHGTNLWQLSIDPHSYFVTKENQVYFVRYHLPATPSDEEIAYTMNRVLQYDVSQSSESFFYSQEFLATLSGLGLQDKLWPLARRVDGRVRAVLTGELPEADRAALATAGFPVPTEGEYGVSLWCAATESGAAYLNLKSGRRLSIWHPGYKACIEWKAAEGEYLECLRGNIVWDPSNQKVVMFLNAPDTILGYPRKVMMWDYRSGCVAKYRLKIPKPDEFR